MMQIQAIHHVSLPVADLDRSRRFYEGVLGLLPDPARPAMAFDGVWYALGAVSIHLLCLPDSCPPAQETVSGGRDRHVAFAVDDIAALGERLRQAGFDFSPSSSGRAALFCRDPDGHALEFLAVR